jgi:hypothetical protein
LAESRLQAGNPSWQPSFEAQSDETFFVASSAKGRSCVPDPPTVDGFGLSKNLASHSDWPAAHVVQ